MRQFISLIGLYLILIGCIAFLTSCSSDTRINDSKRFTTECYQIEGVSTNYCLWIIYDKLEGECWMTTDIDDGTLTPAVCGETSKMRAEEE